MAFEPLFAASPIWTVLLNLEANIRDQADAALKWANDGVAMTPFAEWRRSQWYNTLWPVISIIPLDSDPDQVPDNSRTEWTHRFEFQFEDAGKNADTVCESVVKRAIAVDQILRKLTKQQVMDGRDLTKVGAYHLDITKHEYFQVPRGTTMYLQVSHFTATMNIIESRT